MSRILMEEPKTRPESKRRGIRIEKPENIHDPAEPGNLSEPQSKTPSRPTAVLSTQRRINPFLSFLIFLTYVFSAAALYLVFRAGR